MTRLRTILLLLFISLMVTFSIQITEKFYQQDDSHTPSTERNRIDYSVENFTLTTMGTGGQTQYHLSAANMQHYQDSDETSVTNPNVELFRSSDEHWRIQSLQGKVAPKGKEIKLTGKVEIKRAETSQYKPIIITTESLIIDPERNTVSTKELIRLKGTGIHISANGMLTNLEQDTIKLHAKVRGTYAPQ